MTDKRKAVAEIAALERIWKGSPNYGKGALLEAFTLCTDNAMPLPHWLVGAVRAELGQSIPEQTRKHYRRWREVRKMRDERPHTLDWAKMRPGRSYPANHKLPHREIGYEETLQWVAALLEKTPAAGTPKTIKRSYELVEKELPANQRYRRTYARLLG